jgi:hypothetical protein
VHGIIHWQGKTDNTADNVSVTLDAVQHLELKRCGTSIDPPMVCTILKMASAVRIQNLKILTELCLEQEHFL